MAQIGLYFQTTLDTKVSLLPEQINGDMDRYLLKNLKAKIEGKAIDSGIVIKINGLIGYNHGMIDKANFMGTTVYVVKYECFICSPTANLEIICVINNFVKGFMLGSNGPVTVVVPFNNIDLTKFENQGDQIINKKTKTPIEKDNYVKVSVVNINNNLGEKKMVVLCKLVGVADEDDIRRYSQEQESIRDNDDNVEFI